MDNRDFCSRAIAKLAIRGLEERPTGRMLEQEAPVLTRLANGLRVGYVVDQGEHLQYVQRRHLMAEGVSEADLHRNAIANLSALLRDRGVSICPCGDASIVIFDGHFEASLILVDALWDEALAGFAPNGFIITIPNRDILAFCDSGSVAGLEEIHRIIERGGPGDDQITTTLYHRNPTSRDWRPYRG